MELQNVSLVPVAMLVLAILLLNVPMENIRIHSVGQDVLTVQQDIIVHPMLSKENSTLKSALMVIIVL
jgi:hypothetical protein